MKFDKRNFKIAIIGQGYVGLPLAVEFGKHFKVIGYDILETRINELNLKNDLTNEVTEDQFDKAKYLKFSSDPSDLKDVNVYIITVPTPIDAQKKPDLKPIIDASKLVGKNLLKKDIVIYESTVYPGTTEEICVPILQKNSGLKYNKDFFVGYSPERINPGDKKHRLTNIIKITSGSTPETSYFIDKLYKKIIQAGTHKVSSIKIAEAAKVIENTQRDLNIALINELAVIFDKLNIDTEAVLEAADTKWNFLPFKPGLVGGHCIGVDPYYLMYKAESIGYSPKIITSGRYLNDNIQKYLVNKLKKKMIEKKINIKESKVLIMGFSFKENCPDVRNTGAIKLINDLIKNDISYEVYDPVVDKQDALKHYDINVISHPSANTYDAIIITVAHDEFCKMSIDEIRSFGKQTHVLFDLKYILKNEESDIKF